MAGLVRTLSAVTPWAFDRAAMTALGRAHHDAYHAASPFPHVVIDGLLGDDRSATLARAFPTADHPHWKRRDHVQQARLSQLARSDFAEVAGELRWFLAELGSQAFLDFLAAVTGQRGLIADPHFTGAGPIATLPGGHLALHTDFNRDSARHLDRAVTVLYYLPPTWDPAWGGDLELWDRTRSRCEVAIAPVRDRLVVMAHGADHWHGHPTPLRCPAGHLRAAVTAYYYLARPAPGDDADAHGAVWA
ncbi:MAG: 2OG-Fe(II) oxygenase [Kofleriaceae bacterium]